VKEFTSWLSKVKDWRDPLGRLERIRGEDDSTPRTALVVEQLERLFDAVTCRSVARHQNPKALESYRRKAIERVMIYRVASFAGLRLNEVRTLTCGCLSLDSPKPTYTIRAANSKSGREDTRPFVSLALVDKLREWFHFRTGELGRAPEPSERVFNVPRWITEHLYKDCAFAGVPRVGMHELRHTFRTLLEDAGFSERRIAWLMRQTDIRVSRRYSHPEVLDARKDADRFGEYLRGEAKSAAYLPPRQRISALTSAQLRTEGNLRGSRKPLKTLGFAQTRTAVHKKRMVEAAGIEPASRGMSA